ncbi:MAG: hypothetical protein IPL73_04210 [Candidatus Obscuribacter sp.]|nr:hypothetical protein [Candidatus Obscuribacter sp.]
MSLKLARIYEAEANHLTAEKLVRDCIDDLSKTRSNDLKIANTLSDALIMQERYKEAADVLKGAIPGWDQPLHPTIDNLRPYLLRAKLAMALAESGEVDKAIEITESLIDTLPSDQTKTSPPIAFTAPTIREELLPRLYYALACFYEKKANQTNPPGAKYSRRVIGNLGTALSLTADNLHDRLLRAIILEKTAQFTRTADGGNTPYADRAAKEAASIKKGPDAYRSIRPTIFGR